MNGVQEGTKVYILCRSDFDKTIRVFINLKKIQVFARISLEFQGLYARNLHLIGGGVGHRILDKYTEIKKIYI